MRIEYANGRALLHLEEYADLLALRALPEYRFVGDACAECDPAHLEQIGLAEAVAPRAMLAPSEFLFDYQQWLVTMAVERERFAIFSTTGTGKSLMQLDWARIVTESHGGRTLIVAPLAVVPQTIEEAEHFYGESLPIADLRERTDFDAWLKAGSGIGITNFEKIDRTAIALPVQAVVIDESSAIKHAMGVRRTSIIAAFKGVRWKLCCSATPAPNDRIEYAEHAYFLDQVRSTREFLAAYFVNRDGNWQLKRHGLDAFYRHLASWSVFMLDPKAFRFEHDSDLPELTIEYPAVPATVEQMERSRSFESGDQPSMFGVNVGGITSRIKMSQIANGFVYEEGKVSARFPARKPEMVAELCEKYGDEQVIVWITFDEEGDQIARLVPDAVHLSGKMARVKRDAIVAEFRAGGGPRVLLLKPSMFSHGLNLQACRVQVFSSISDSWERLHQCIRRSWRYGQTRPVHVYIPLSPFDDAVASNLADKQSTYDHDSERMQAAFVAALRPIDSTERRTHVTLPSAELDRAEGEGWTLIHGDCIAHMPTMREHSMDFAVFSPPFANLFTYSSALGDMGNVKSDVEFRLQWKWFAEHLVRVMKPGRNVAIHVMDIIRFAGQHGVRHTYDFPSDLRQGMQDAGFLYRARITIHKDPQVQAVRTKDANLLFVTLKRNALDSHPQAQECVLLFTAPGEPETPVLAPDVTNVEWIEWAHSVWFGIREMDVLNAALGKEHEDERHICCLQLPLIERCVRLWTNPGETVFSPFGGIGSEGVRSLEWGRKAYLIELKQSYFQTAARNLHDAEIRASSKLDFGTVAAD